MKPLEEEAKQPAERAISTVAKNMGQAPSDAAKKIAGRRAESLDAHNEVLQLKTADLVSKIQNIRGDDISNKKEVVGGRTIMQHLVQRIRLTSKPDDDLFKALTKETAEFMKAVQDTPNVANEETESAATNLAEAVKDIFGAACGVCDGGQFEKQDFAVLYTANAVVRVDFIVYSRHIIAAKWGYSQDSMILASLASVAVTPIEKQPTYLIAYLISRSVKNPTEEVEKIKDIYEAVKDLQKTIGESGGQENEVLQNQPESEPAASAA